MTEGTTMHWSCSNCGRMNVLVAGDVPVEPSCGKCGAPVVTHRVSRGLYRHYKGGSYFVLGVGVEDEHGHGNLDAPRLVMYESTQSLKTGVANIHKEEDFLKIVEWPDGKLRPRFIRMEE